MAERKFDEMESFGKWQATGDKRHFQALYQSMKPLLDSAANKASYGSNLPKSAHEIWAAQSFMNALNTYKPNKEVTLQTHVYGAVHQKAKRLNYLYQNLGQISETRASQIGRYQNESANLVQELGRPPSAVELADRLDMSLKDVERLQKEVHKDLSLGGLEEEVIVESPREEEILTYIYYELSNEERLVYDYAFGKHGKKRLGKASGKTDYDKIATTVGFSVSKVRSLFNSIKSKYEKASR